MIEDMLKVGGSFAADVGEWDHGVGTSGGGDVVRCILLAFSIDCDMESEGLNDGKRAEVVEPGSDPVGFFFEVGDDDVQIGRDGSDVCPLDGPGRRRRLELRGSMRVGLGGNEARVIRIVRKCDGD